MQLRELDPDASEGSHTHRAARALHEAQDAINQRAYTIVGRGILLRSVKLGLVDFPSMSDSRGVLRPGSPVAPPLTY